MYEIDNSLTMEKIMGLIVSQEFIVMGKKTTVCCITLKNGFEIIGYSACVDPKNFNRSMGESLAMEKAVDKIWELEGYLLQNNLKGDE